MCYLTGMEREQLTLRFLMQTRKIMVFTSELCSQESVRRYVQMEYFPFSIFHLDLRWP